MLRVVVPAALVIVPSGVALGVYNRAVTGSAFRLPYAVYEAAYNPVPVFALWQRPGPAREYRHETLRAFFNGWVMDQWSAQRTPGGWWRYHRKPLVEWIWPFYVGPFVLPLLAAPLALRKRGTAFLAFECVLVVAAHLTTVGIQPHYAAPVFGCFMLLVVEGLRRLALVRVGGVRVGGGLVGLTVVMVLVQLGLLAHTRATAAPGWEADRARIERALTAEGGLHLVVVRYGPGHDPLREWVYNRAAIDRAPVVWARETDPARLASLLSYFRGRHAWLLEADEQPPRLCPLPRRERFTAEGAEKEEEREVHKNRENQVKKLMR
jgi:hypothetical protein